jgi:hypothetical protein
MAMEHGPEERRSHGSSRLAAISLAAAMALSILLLGQFTASLPGADKPVQSVAWLFGPAAAATPAQ